MTGAGVAFVISLDSREKYTRLLAGPPQNRAFRSGLVNLGPGESVGKHSTEDYEELLIVLEGQGEMLGKEGPLQINKARAVYCPPNTEHDVRNTGQDPFRYVYIVTKTR